MKKRSLVILLLLLLAACQPASDDAVETDGLAAATPEDGVILTEGVIEPLSYVDLSFESGGRLAELYVKEGDRVQAGDRLARLETGTAEAALQEAQAHLTVAQAGLAAAQPEYDVALASIETAQVQVTIAQAQLALLQSGPLPEEIAVARARLAAAEAAVVEASGYQATMLNVATDAAIRAAEADVAAAAADRRALEEAYDAILTNCQTQADGSQWCPQYGPMEEGTRAQLAAARAAETAAQARLDQLAGGPSSAQRAAAGGGVAVALANRDVAQAQLDQLLAGPTAGQVAQAEVRVSEAEVGVSQAGVRVTAAEAAVLQAEASVEAAQIAVNAAQLAMDRLTLFATSAGTVARVHASPGELVAAGAGILTLADVGGWQVRTTDLSELDVARIEVGTPAVVTLEALPDAAIAGTVARVAIAPSLSQGDVVYTVTIRLAPAAQMPAAQMPAAQMPAAQMPLRWGMTTAVTLKPAGGG